MSTPVEAQDFFNRGVDRLQSGEWKSAIDDFTEAIKLRPDVAIGWRYRSYAYADGGNFTRAIADLDEAIRLKPDDVQSYFDRAHYFWKQKEFHAALQDCNKGLELDAGRVDLLALRGRIQAERGDSDAALEDLSRAIQSDPDGAVEYLRWRGNLFVELENYPSAIDDFTQSLNRNTNQPTVLSDRAQAYWLNGNPDEALADLDAAIALQPEDHWLYVRRGVLRHDRTEYELAIADYSLALTKRPDYILAHEYRADSYYRLGKRNEAIQDLADALKLNPSPSQSLRILNRRAMWYYFNRDFTRALRDHLDALKKEPNDAATFNYLAWIWATAPDPSVRNGRRALECATRANELTEWEYPGYLDTLAAAHAEMGQFQEAMKWQEKAIELARDEDSRLEYINRLKLYEEHEPLRVQPREGV